MKATKVKTKQVQKLRIKIQAYEPKILDASVKQVMEIADRMKIEVIGPVPMPTSIKKYTVNRSTFVFKDSREQFEMRTHTRIIDVLKPSQEIIETIGSISLPAGVFVEAQIV